MGPQPSNSQIFYRWVDSEGRLHVVSSLDAVPAAERPKVAPVVLNAADAVHIQRAATPAPAWEPDAPSLAIGFGAALALCLLFKVLPGSWRWLSRTALTVGVVGLLMAAYLGLVRRSTGAPSAGVLASPSAFIQDAKAAVEQMNARQKHQEEELRRIQAEGR